MSEALALDRLRVNERRTSAVSDDVVEGRADAYELVSTDDLAPVRDARASDARHEAGHLETLLEGLTGVLGPGS